MSELAAVVPEPGPGLDRLGELLSTVIESVDAGLGVRGWASSDAQVMHNARLAHRATGMLEALRLGVLRQLNLRPDAISGAAPGGTAAAFLVHALNVSPRQAARDVVVAAALDPDGDVLPVMGAALAAGEVSRAHAEVAVSTLAAIPAAVKKAVADDGRTGTERIDAFLVEHSRTLPPAAISVLAAELVATLDPDRVANRLADAHARRDLSTGTDALGMLQGRFQLDPESAAVVTAALQRFAKPLPAGTAVDESGEQVIVPDRRSRGQRQADALTEIAATALEATGGTAPDDHGCDAPDEPADTEPGDAEPGDAEPAESAAATAEPADTEAPTADGSATDSDAGTSDAATGSSPSTAAGSAGPASAGDGSAFRRPVPGLRCGRARVEVLVIADLAQVAASLGAPNPSDPLGRAAGLARISLAGRGDWPGATLDPATLARFLCDSPLRRVLVAPSGAVLDLGRSQRLASPAQRKALSVRDGGCVIPGCTVPPEYSDIHHVIPWAAGGPTDLDRLVLLCSRHHTAVHAGEWQITMRDGVPWVRPPTWIDAHQRPLRNTTHQRRRDARALGTQLRLQVDTRTTPPPASDRRRDPWRDPWPAAGPPPPEAGGPAAEAGGWKTWARGPDGAFGWRPAPPPEDPHHPPDGPQR